MSPLPFYLDWQFWSAVVAATALLLSQLPPIHILLRRPRIRCEAFSRMHLTHKVGNPNAQWHLIIENTGGKAVRIKSISLVFTKEGGKSFVLAAQNYLRTPDASENVMLTPFRLAPDEEWAHVLTFFTLFSREDNKEYRLLESTVRSEIVAQKEDPANKDKLCEANPQSVQRLINFFERHFKWEPGEYVAELKIITDIAKANVSQQFRFTLFESESNELRSYKDSYRYGAGVYWVSPAQPGLLVPVREK